MRRLLLLLLTCLLPIPAYASDPPWLDRAWSDQGVEAHDGDQPSITLHPDGTVLVTLPRAVLDEAKAAGVDAQQATLMILERYGQHCSDVLNLDKPQKMHVELFVSASASAELGIPGLFITGTQALEFDVQYAPSRQAVCVQPWEVPTS